MRISGTEPSSVILSQTWNFDYTKTADRLRTESLGNESHPTGVVKPVYGIPTFPLTAKAVLSKGHTFEFF